MLDWIIPRCSIVNMASKILSCRSDTMNLSFDREIQATAGQKSQDQLPVEIASLKRSLSKLWTLEELRLSSATFTN